MRLLVAALSAALSAVVAVSVPVSAGCGRRNFGDRDAATTDGDDVQVDVDAVPDADTRLPNLLAWYGMEDDPSDGMIDDTGGAGTGRAAHCIAGVSCPTQVAGKHGMALQFDGVNQYARVLYNTWLATPTAYTIAGWIYLDTQVDQVAFAKPWGSAQLDSWGITAWASGAGTCLETVTSALASQDVCGPTIPTGQWLHVAGRWNGSVKSVFINGVKAGELMNATTSVIDTHDVIIGGDENSGTPAYLFHGRVDEVQLYDRALTDLEISMLAQ